MEIKQDTITIKELIELKKSNMISVNPEYQRGAVWNDPQQKKLIDSVLRNYALPLIYLHLKKKDVAGMHSESLEIIDGQQRINALYKFSEGALKLFDPIKDDKEARFPNFIKQTNCDWASCDFLSLPDELKNKFNETILFVAYVTTDVEDEARDLFIRLQAGLPLNAQEKRDAWPGGYTEFVLKFGGKKEIVRYPGHEFFQKLVSSPSTDRGSVRTLCAQLGMLYFENATKRNWLDIGTQSIDDYYYTNLDFNIENPKVTRLAKILDYLVELLINKFGPKLKVHEVIHLVLLVDSLIDDYTISWKSSFAEAFLNFREKANIDKRNQSGDFWFKYVVYTQTQASNPKSIAIRHKFFTEKMFEFLKPVLKDKTRLHGQIEREIIYYRDKRICAVCETEIKWDDLEIHHVLEHQHGGSTSIENAVAVHKSCHPKGKDAESFYKKWLTEKAEFDSQNLDKSDFEFSKPLSPARQKLLDYAEKYSF